MNPVLPLERFYGFWDRRNPMPQGEVAGVVRQMMSIYVGVMVYGGILSSVMLFNAWVLSADGFNFPFPITLKMIHMAFSGCVAFMLVHVFRVVPPVNMTYETYSRYVIPISIFSALNLLFSFAAYYLHISVAFIQMLGALVHMATYLEVRTFRRIMTWRPGWAPFLIGLLLGAAFTIASHGAEIHFNMFVMVCQLAGVISGAYKLILIEMLLQREDPTLHPVTGIYYIAPCSFMCLAIPWYFLEWPTIEALNFRDQFTFWVLFANAACALVIYSAALLIIKRTSALTYWVAGEVRGWTMEVLSSKRTLLNTIGYAIALGGAMICSYSTRTDNPGPNLPADGSPQERTEQNSDSTGEEATARED